MPLPAQSSSPPVGRDVNRSPQLLLALWLTTAIALIFFVCRIYVRLRVIKHHGWDDYWITGSIILGILGCSLETVSVKYGFGKKQYYLTTEQIIVATKYNMIAIPPNLFSSAMAKVSVCFFLIHVNQNKKTGYFLYSMAVTLLVFSAATTILLLTQCQPIEALWNRGLVFTGHGHCLNPVVNGSLGLAQSVFFCLADLTFAFFPLTFLWKLQMNKRTKLALGFVLSLGLIAGAFGIVRCVELHEITTRADILFATVDLAIWSFLEQNVTIIAACIPVLYTVVRTWLGQRSTGKTGYSNTGRSGRKPDSTLRMTHGSGAMYGQGSRIDRKTYQELGYELHGTTHCDAETDGDKLWSENDKTMFITGPEPISTSVHRGNEDASSEEAILGSGRLTHQKKLNGGIIRTTEVRVTTDTENRVDRGGV